MQIFIVLISVLGSNLYATHLPILPSLSTIVQEGDSLYYNEFLKYRVDNIDSALKYASLSYHQSLRLNDSELTIKSLNAIGYCYYRKSLFDSALFNYKKGVEQSKLVQNELRQIYFYNSIGIVYDDMGKYDSAIANFYSSLELARKLEKEKDISIAITNIGNVNLDLGNVESALNYYKQSMEIKERNNFAGLEIVYYNIGLCYDQLSDPDNALKYFHKVIEICKTGDCNQIYKEKGLLGIGISYLRMEELKQAEKYLNQVTDSEDIPTRIVANRSLAELFLLRSNFKKALDHIDLGNRLATSINSKESLKNNYLTKSNIFNEMGQTDSAFHYFHSYHAIKDSLFNESVAKSIQDLFVGFERKQADAEIQVKEREIAARKRANLLFALVILLSISLIVKIIMDLSKRKRINKYLDKQVALKTSELTQTNRNLIEKSRDLDNLIYNISHEIRGPLARLLGLINIGQLETSENSGSIKYYNELRNEAVDLERILKRMIIINNVNNHKVRKVKLDLNQFFNNLLDNSRYLWQDKIVINLKVNGVTELETDEVLLEIALQNIIDNAAKFRDMNSGEDPKLEIEVIKDKKNGIDIIFQDNGIGFDEQFKDTVTDLFFVANEKGGTGMGLHHTKLALEKLGAELEVSSNRNPTTFIVHLRE